MDIKEIALRIGLEVFEEHPYDNGHVVSPSGYTWIDDKLIEFAEALIAELAKQNEPVARLLHSKTRSLQESCRTVARTYEECKKDAYPDDWEEGKPLYTNPPTIEQIANETAWQPIETAPKGERFLTTTKLSNGSFGQVGISHSFFCYEVNTRDWEIAGDDPCATHWMPLPTPPKQSMEGV